MPVKSFEHPKFWTYLLINQKFFLKKRRPKSVFFYKLLFFSILDWIFFNLKVIPPYISLKNIIFLIFIGLQRQEIHSKGNWKNDFHFSPLFFRHGLKKCIQRQLKISGITFTVWRLHLIFMQLLEMCSTFREMVLEISATGVYHFSRR